MILEKDCENKNSVFCFEDEKDCTRSRLKMIWEVLIHRKKVVRKYCTEMNIFGLHLTRTDMWVLF